MRYSLGILSIRARLYPKRHGWFLLRQIGRVTRREPLVEMPALVIAAARGETEDAQFPGFELPLGERRIVR